MPEHTDPNLIWLIFFVFSLQMVLKMGQQAIKRPLGPWLVVVPLDVPLNLAQDAVIAGVKAGDVLAHVGLWGGHDVSSSA